MDIIIFSFSYRACRPIRIESSHWDSGFRHLGKEWKASVIVDRLKPLETVLDEGKNNIHFEGWIKNLLKFLLYEKTSEGNRVVRCGKGWV